MRDIAFDRAILGLALRLGRVDKESFEQRCRALDEEESALEVARLQSLKHLERIAGGDSADGDLGEQTSSPA